MTSSSTTTYCLAPSAKKVHIYGGNFTLCGQRFLTVLSDSEADHLIIGRDKPVCQMCVKALETALEE